MIVDVVIGWASAPNKNRLQFTLEPMADDLMAVLGMIVHAMFSWEPIDDDQRFLTELMGHYVVQSLGQSPNRRRAIRSATQLAYELYLEGEHDLW